MKVNKINNININETEDVGIVVGRFQVHKLHDAHKDLIQTVLDKHPKAIIFLGLSPARCTFNNPLDFRTRKAMINEEYPDLEVHYQDDCPSDEVWSKNLDAQITKWLKPMQTVMLYGSRDSFLPHYTGKFKTCELEPDKFISGTEIRRQIINNYKPTVDYRAGIIAATGNRYPVAYQAVDVAIFNEDRSEMLMAQKPTEKLWRFVGGFSEPTSDSLESDVRKEALEEANVEVGDITYVGSMLTNDWRYRCEKDRIKTALFTSKYLFGKPEGGDDVAFVKWFKTADIKNNYKNNVETVHHSLVEMLINKGVI